MVESSKFYNKLVVGTKKDWVEDNDSKRIYDSLLGIRAMGVSQCYVLFLSLLRNKKKIGFDLSNYFREIENFTFNYSAVSKLQANKVEKIYSKNAIEIEKALSEGNKKYITKNIQRILDLMLHELRELRPTALAFEEDFMGICYKNSEKARVLVKYILSKINRSMSSGEFELDFDVVNIEHVLPQNPSKEWEIKKSGIKDFVNLLGNLVLVHETINSRAGNKSLKEKAKILKDSDIILTKQFIEEVSKTQYKWGESEIIKRQRELAGIAYKVWSF